MAKSNAKKFRDHLARQGKRNPEDNRHPLAAAYIQLTSKQTKTKQEKLRQQKHKKNRYDHQHDGHNGSFLFRRNAM